MASSIIPVERIRAHILIRFPEDFMFQLTKDEFKSLRDQIGTFEKGRGTHRKDAPLVFTEEGVAALSGVLRSPRAIQVNIDIVRTFVQLRRYALTHDELRARLDELEKNTRKGFRTVFAAIRKLMEPEAPAPKRTRGFGR